jgi:hypothetical protein
MDRPVPNDLTPLHGPPLDRRAGAYARAVAEKLRGVLADDLAAVYLIGSLVLGDYVPGRSDIDILAVSADGSLQHSKEVIVEELSHPRLACPARGLEFVMYTKTSAATVTRIPRFALNLNTGPGMDEHVSFDPASEPAHWFILDIALARKKAIALVGPPAADLFGPVPEDWMLHALIESLEWHARHETLAHYSVLNACRSWRLAEEGVFDSKAGAAAWARPRMQDATILDSALALREGMTTPDLDGQVVRAFLWQVRARVLDIRARRNR